MTPRPVRIGRSGLGPGEPGCYAPTNQLFLNPQGDVAPCGRLLRPLGNVAVTPLLDIWRSAERAALAEAVARHDYGLGCESCGTEVEVEGWDGSYPAQFAARRRRPDAPADARGWPTWIDFNVSNTCNLQCIQCSGELSSAIRSKREKRPPLPKVYGDQFFEDLRHFIPHLEGAHFAGGEPFLTNENYRIWDLIAELRPDLPIVVTSNGTTFTPRVERVLAQLRFSFVFSIDGIRPDTYRSIRVGGELEQVLANVERFRSYAASIGTSVSINHCLMNQNVHEFADLLLWAEERQIPVNVSVVRAPTECSIARLDPDGLAVAHAVLSARDAEAQRGLQLNLATWDREVRRIATWAATAAAEPEHLVRFGQTVLTFRIQGDEAHDERAALRDLASFAPDGMVHVLVVGLDDVIRSCSSSLREAHPALVERLVGQPFDAVGEATVDAFGPLVHFENLSATASRSDAIASHTEIAMRIALVAVRGEDGAAIEGRILVAFRSVSSSASDAAVPPGKARP